MLRRNKMKTWLKVGLIGLAVWLVLIILHIIGANIGTNPCEIEYPGEGASCYTGFQESVMLVIYFVGFIGGMLGSPVLSTFGPTGVLLFYIGSALTFFLWGALIGFIIQKIRKK